MTRFHRNRNSGFRGRAIVLLATTACMGSAHAVEPERVIFAAENALYGAGFDIGRADGWIDGKLQEAIRGYQTANGLQANGNLDAATLKALGVHAAPAKTIAANSVASRQQSAEVLGLASPAPTPPAKTVAKAEIESTPEPQPEPQATPEPRHQPEQTLETGAEPTPEKPEDQRISKETSTPIEVEDTGGTVVVAEKSEPAIAETPAPATEPDPEPEPAVVVVDTAPSDSPAEKDPVLAQLPTEPTSPENQQPEEPVAQEPETSQSAQLDNPEPVNQTTANKSRSSGGGFFSALFDFFFGWLV